MIQTAQVPACTYKKNTLRIENPISNKLRVFTAPHFFAIPVAAKRTDILLEEANTMATRSRLGDIRSRYEAPPPPVEKERVQSAVDAPGPEVSSTARAAARLSKQQTAAVAEAPQRRRITPAITHTDSDELRALKRTAQAKELEIQNLAAKFQTLAERLSRLTSQFDAAKYAPVVAATPNGARVKSTEYVSGATAARSAVSSAEKATRGSTGSTGSTQKSSTSLEAILAAARSGDRGSGKASAPVKFSKIIRDFK